MSRQQIDTPPEVEAAYVREQGLCVDGIGAHIFGAATSMCIFCGIPEAEYDAICERADAGGPSIGDNAPEPGEVPGLRRHGDVSYEPADGAR